MLHEVHFLKLVLDLIKPSEVRLTKKHFFAFSLAGGAPLSSVKSILTLLLLVLLVAVKDILDVFELAFLGLFLLIWVVRHCRPFWLDLKALVLKFIMLNQLVRPAVVGIPLIDNILAHLIKRFGDVEIEVE